MEELGFYQEPWIILKERMPNQKEIIDILIQKADRTFETLMKAWELRPQGNEAVEDQLLQALAKTQKLQNELRMIIKYTK